METYLEIWGARGPEPKQLSSDRVSIGKDPNNDIVVDTDPMVSHVHAMLERVGPSWSVRDLGSRNGTFVNGERISGDRVLKPGDEIRVGETRLVFRALEPMHRSVTVGAQAAPSLTRREHEVLLELCKPLLSGSLFTEPASIREIAAGLFIAEGTVKQHLLRLYDKFEIDEGQRRRVRLANGAIQRGAVSLADLRD